MIKRSPYYTLSLNYIKKLKFLSLKYKDNREINKFTLSTDKHNQSEPLEILSKKNHFDILS